MEHYKHQMNSYKPRSPNREYGRYAEWIDDEYETSYWRFRHLSVPKNRFTLWDITYGSEAYDKQDIRSTVKRWESWEGESATLTFTTYFNEIRKAYSKKKKKEIKSVYRPYGRG